MERRWPQEYAESEERAVDSGAPEIKCGWGLSLSSWSDGQQECISGSNICLFCMSSMESSVALLRS